MRTCRSCGVEFDAASAGKGRGRPLETCGECRRAGADKDRAPLGSPAGWRDEGVESLQTEARRVLGWLMGDENSTPRMRFQAAQVVLKTYERPLAPEKPEVTEKPKSKDEARAEVIELLSQARSIQTG